ncbi:MAG: AI-2E family transporter [Pseudomonadota bacterium]|nr:AI-2E family transporter [Pseudomonadota bacterium]
MTQSRKHWFFWFIMLGSIFLGLWLTSKVLLPFVAGFALAYMLDPLVDRVVGLRLSRGWATAAVLMIFVIIVALIILLIAPVLAEQTVSLIHAIPGYIDHVREHILPQIQHYIRQLSPRDADQLKQAASNFTGTAVSWATVVAGTVVSGGLALVDIAGLLFITPVVAFYLLRDWDLIVARIDEWLPRPLVPVIREEARQINVTLSGFIRGQAAVCLILGLFYGIALSLAGLQFGLAIGLIVGLLSFMPYVGSLVGFVASTGVALFQFDDWVRVLIVVGIFFLGQAIEGNFLTPRLVGGKVGLHPVWVIFALLAGGSLFGFLGVLLAVPVAAVIGVLVRFALRRYLNSSYYQGQTLPAPPPESV